MPPGLAHITSVWELEYFVLVTLCSLLDFLFTLFSHIYDTRTSFPEFDPIQNLRCQIDNRWIYYIEKTN